MTDIKLGLFYQSGHKITAPFYSLERFRKYYPTEPIVLYEDGASDVLKPVSDYFKCIYKKTTITGENYETYGKPVYNLESALDWIERIYLECNTSLRDCDWIMLYEDDVWIENKIEGNPPYDLTGIWSHYINDELKKYINSNTNDNFGRGGSIFNRQTFIDSYETWKNIDWEKIVAIDRTPVEWSDCTITFYFDYCQKSIGGWDQLVHCFISRDFELNKRESWKTKPQEVDKHTEGAAVIHGYKGYYFPTEEEIEYVNTKLNEFTKPIISEKINLFEPRLDVMEVKPVYSRKICRNVKKIVKRF